MHLSQKGAAFGTSFRGFDNVDKSKGVDRHGTLAARQKAEIGDRRLPLQPHSNLTSLSSHHRSQLYIFVFMKNSHHSLEYG